MLTTIKNLLTKTWVRVLLALIAGGVLTALFMQETIMKKKTEDHIKEVTLLTAQLNSTKQLLVEKTTELSRKRRSETTKETKPDGSSVTKTVVVEDTEVVERMRKDYEEKLAQSIKQTQEKDQHTIQELTVEKNRKRIDLYFGVQPAYLPLQRVFFGGFNYPIWGPFTIGLSASTLGVWGPTIGVRF